MPVKALRWLREPLCWIQGLLGISLVMFLLGLIGSHTPARLRIVTHKHSKTNWFDPGFTTGAVKDLLQNSEHLQVYADKWIILTSISHPTDVVKKLATLDDWKVVMVADQKTPLDWHHENVVCLSVKDQQQLPYQILKHVPWNNYGRKNIGYMYAIHHGAKIIYETDDDNSLIVPSILGLSPGSLGQAELSVNVTTQPAVGHYTFLNVPDDEGVDFNPYPMFGVPQMWPRGLPLQSIKNPQPNCFKRAPGNPIVQQGLANNDPDVDALYRLTLPLGVTFDKNMFSVLLPRNVMTPFNSQNTLFLQDALWALVLPVTTTMRVCDIWRGYWAQRLLWDISGHLAFIPPTVIQNRNPHTVFNDFEQELPLYNQAGSLLHDLRHWSPTSNSVPERMVELAQFMADHQYWGQGDLQLMQAWVSDLEDAKYVFPSIPPQIDPKTAEVQAAGQLNTSTWQTGAFAFATQWCRSPTTILVVNINQVSEFHADITRLLYAAYKPWFREVYFTADIPESQGTSIHHNLVQCHSTNRRTGSIMPGHFAYVCLAEVMAHVGSTVASGGVGYLYINDDVTFSPGMLSKLNKSRIWYDSSRIVNHREAQRMAGDINVLDVRNNSVWHFSLDFSNGQMPGRLGDHTHKALASAYGWMAHQVKQRLADQEHEGLHIFGPGQGDYFYVPSHLAHDYGVWARHMRAYHVFTEVAVPNILGLLGNNTDDYEIFPAVMLWDGHREGLVASAESIMPLQRNLSLSAICKMMGAPTVGVDNSSHVSNAPPGCLLTASGSQPVSDSAQTHTDAFAVHPTKLSDVRLRRHWTLWWQSQRCEPSTP